MATTQPKQKGQREPAAVKAKAQAASIKPYSKDQKTKNAVQEKRKFLPYALAVIAIAIVVAIAFLLLNPRVTSQVPFQTFKQNFNSAPRVAIALTYTNDTNYANEVPCMTNLVEIVGRTRNASTIDLLILNSTSCTYSPGGLGVNAQIKTTNASTCLRIANSEPSLFLNSSISNSTLITANHMYVNANQEYLAKCSIAAEFG